MQTSEYNYLFKLLIDDSGVRSPVYLFSLQTTHMESCISTMGVESKFHTIELEGKAVKLQIRDTGRQPGTLPHDHLFLHGGVHGTVVVMDNDTFLTNVEQWLQEIDRYVSEALRAQTQQMSGRRSTRVHEIFIVDNGSKDDTKACIGKVETRKYRGIIDRSIGTAKTTFVYYNEPGVDLELESDEDDSE